MTIRYSCVMDTPAKFQHQALLWALSLVHCAGQAPGNLLVHAVEGTSRRQIDLLREFGVGVVVVPRYSSELPFLNKLRQLESEDLRAADHVVLCDTDLAFCSSIDDWVQGDRPRIKIVDVANPPLTVWRNLFAAAGFNTAPRPAATSLDGEQTYANNCNGGLCILPRAVFLALPEVWPRWIDWTWRQGHVLGRFRTHCFQISFALAMEELGIEVDLLPLALNFPTNLMTPGLEARDVSPAVIHYHANLDALGDLRPIGLRQVDAAVNRINGLMAAEARTALMRDYRARVQAANSAPARAQAQLGRALRKARQLLSRYR
jgi:hypothetical protein